ncbi:MAG: autotransporter outer membrane beta-barrel domain-containing protein [Verrucomicrobiaceae bacterium]|nr:MAG: autotransporter outer membrane beta-barrel domain-containing protein [Verrucomicrobiaceae bacterium]
MDLRGNADYYFSRPNDQLDLTGSLAFSFLHRITPRMQFSASASLSYLSQPDVRLVNGPSRNVGDYFSATSKFDLSYRWTKRFTTVTSFSLNSLLYSQAAQQFGDYYEGVLGTEARYGWSPRLTLLADVRYGQISYPNNSLLNTHTLYLLLGGEYALSRQISTSLRLGESIRTFDESGGSSAAPYAEATASWRYSPRGFLSLNSRFGFEESGSAETETQSLRVGLSATHAFSARLRGSMGVTYVHRTSTNEIANTDFAEQTFDFNLGFDYAFSKRMSFNGSYVFTTSTSDAEANDYYRNRIFLGVQYSF